MPRIATILCIQNAASSLSWWIAHHVAVGFSTLLICDDHSSDGSWEILTQAAQHYDIRLSKTDKNITNTYTRHQHAMIELLRTESDIDWAIPLSCDEYVLPAHDSVDGLIKKTAQELGEDAFQKRQHIPLNWCICGLNQQPILSTLDRPSPRALYTHHAPQDFLDHHVTRSFFRPQSIQDSLPDPFLYSKSSPNWSLGRILHDASSTIPKGAAQHHYDRNDILYNDSKRFLNASNDIAATLLQTLILDHCRTIKYHQEKTHTDSLQQSCNINLNQYCLGSFERFLVIDHNTRCVVWRESDLYNPQQETRLCITIFSETVVNENATSPAWLYTEKALSISYLPINSEGQRLSHLSDILPLTVTHLTDGVELSLIHEDGKIEVQGLSIFPLFPLAHNNTHKPYLALKELTRQGLSANGILNSLHTMPYLAPTAFAAASAHLSYDDAKQVLSPLLLRIIHSYHA